MIKKMGKKRVFKFVSGQEVYINAEKNKLMQKKYEVYTDVFYQANGIDYRRNVQRRVKNCVDDKFNELNADALLRRADLKQEIIYSNEKLKKEIGQYKIDLIKRVNVYNATHTDKVKQNMYGNYYTGFNKMFAKVRSYKREHRSFISEARSNKKYHIINIDIKICSLWISWSPNPYISFKELTNMFKCVNAETQCSPYVADDE